MPDPSHTQPPTDGAPSDAASGAPLNGADLDAVAGGLATSGDAMCKLHRHYAWQHILPTTGLPCEGALWWG